LLHYYIESGIPVSVELSSEFNRESGHSIICIGHKGNNDVRKSLSEAGSKEINDKIAVINSADLCDKYVIIDDNQPPYTVSIFDKLTIHNDLHVSALVVVLYKNIAVDALYASEVFEQILKDEVLGILANDKHNIRYSYNETRSGGIMEDQFTFVTRLFMASSNTFRNFKTAALSGANGDYTERDRQDALIYSQVLMPKLIWVLQIYTKESYADGQAIAEIIIDPTSGNKLERISKAIIALNYPDVFYMNDLKKLERSSREPYSSVKTNERYFRQFTGNLTEV
jgi:hypothetical protein